MSAGSRAGVNLRGLDRENVPRGSWLVAPELAGRVARRFDAWVRVLPGARPLRSGEKVRLHHGTTQYIARVAPLDGRHIPPGTAAPAVVRLDGDAPVEPHDRFILRTLSPVATIGGGLVLAAAPRRWHGRERHAAFLDALLAGDARRAALELSADAGRAGLTTADLMGLGFAPAAAREALAGAAAAGDLELLPEPASDGAKPGSPGAGRRWFRPGTLAELRSTLLMAAGERAGARPERPFSAVGELAALTPELPAGDVDLLLLGLVADGELVAGEGGYAPAGAGVLGAEQTVLAEQALDRLRREPLVPPTLASMAEELRRPPRDITQVLDVLTRRGDLVRVDKDLWFLAESVSDARRELEAMLAADGEVTLAGFRDRMGFGRRNAQALLELFDREGLTLRRGDVRVARRRR